MPWDFWLIFFVLGILLPWRGRERMRQLMALPEVSSRDRIKLYLTTILFQWALTLLIAWRGLARGLAMSQLGLRSPLSLGLLATTAIGALLIGLAHWANIRRIAKSDLPNAKRLRELGARLFPRTPMEKALFVLLALTAGVCEEFLFRGFVMSALARAGLAAWMVVVISAVMFGVAHLYQGKGGSIGTGILGTIFAVVRIAYDSLLPVVVWHAVLDIVAGLAGSRFALTTQNAKDEIFEDIHR